MEECIPLPETTTVFQAEVIAIREASIAINNRMDMGFKYLKFFCDSQAALKALNNKNVSSRTVLQTYESLDRLAQAVNRCTLVWIKAHVGHIGNEEADSLARRATTISEGWLNPPVAHTLIKTCLLYTSPSPRDGLLSRMPSSA